MATNISQFLPNIKEAGTYPLPDGSYVIVRPVTYETEGTTGTIPDSFTYELVKDLGDGTSRISSFDTSGKFLDSQIESNSDGGFLGFLGNLAPLAAFAVGGNLLGSALAGAGAGAAGAGAGAAGTGAALTGADLAIALGEGMVPIASTAGQAAAVTGNLGALGAGLGLGDVAGAAGAASGAGSGTATGTGAASGAGGAASGAGGLLTAALKNPQLLASLLNLLGAGAAGAIGGGGGGGSGSGAGAIPTQGVPMNTPEYYQAIQNYYNAYLPGTNPNVGSSLADWYGGKYTA